MDTASSHDLSLSLSLSHYTTVAVIRVRVLFVGVLEVRKSRGLAFMLALDHAHSETRHHV